MVTIVRVFRTRSEPSRIHYIIKTASGHDRHLYVDRGNPLYNVLLGHLKFEEPDERELIGTPGVVGPVSSAIGPTGPRGPDGVTPDEPGGHG